MCGTYSYLSSGLFRRRASFFFFFRVEPRCVAACAAGRARAARTRARSTDARSRRGEPAPAAPLGLHSVPSASRRALTVQGAMRQEGGGGDDDAAVWVFAYGSLVNADSAAAQLGAGGAAAQAARLRAEAGYARAWSFRSPTGFTALGVAAAVDEGAARPINGALLRVSAADLPALAARESGYARVELDAALFERPGADADSDDGAPPRPWPRERVHMWVPDEHGCPSEDCPILQSYVDVCLQGFLALGGEVFAREFVESTGGWCEWFLNDCVQSRRPWLHRGKAYAELDRVLAQSAGVSASRHPEEFAALQLRRHVSSKPAPRSDGGTEGAAAAHAHAGAAVQARGLWGVPARNSLFTGREGLLEAMRSRLCLSKGDSALPSVMKALAVVGMGGVGKSQTVAEYVTRSAACRAQRDIASHASAPCGSTPVAPCRMTSERR